MKIEKHQEIYLFAISLGLRPIFYKYMFHQYMFHYDGKITTGLYLTLQHSLDTTTIATSL